MSHWIIVPVLLPLFTALASLFATGRGLRVQRLVSLVGTVGLLAVAALLVRDAAGGGYVVYRLGDWPAPFGIVLVLDRLSGMMVLLTAAIAFFSMLHSLQGADAEGPHYHTLFQLQLAGLNGAFLTGDLFNLFVFFEILLIASYCLLVHGASSPRLRAGIHYVVLNLTGSALFLIAVATLYGVTGTLNMADMSVRVAALGSGEATLVQAGALLLLAVFALKAALVPLYFWLPSAYSAASAPVAALFAIMTKVGVYSIVRIYTLVFGPDAGVAAEVAAPWLLPLALGTIVLGMLGAMASQGLRRMQGYLLIGSVGIMLAAIGLFTEAAVAAGLYYMVHSTLAIAAMFLLADLIARQRGGAGDLLARAQPLIQPGILGALFFTGAIAIIGLPPLSGFIGKALILSAAFPAPSAGWVWAVILGGGFIALVTLARAGAVVFWNTDPGATEPYVGGPLASTIPAAGLLAGVILMTVMAGPVTDYMIGAADQLFRPESYINAVLGGR